jgi:hypothetical protein
VPRRRGHCERILRFGEALHYWALQAREVERGRHQANGLQVGLGPGGARRPDRIRFYVAAPIISLILSPSTLNANGFVSMSMPRSRKPPRTAAFLA